MKRYSLACLLLLAGCGSPEAGSPATPVSTTSVGIGDLSGLPTAELLEKLNDPAPPARDRAALALGRRGAEVVDALIEALKDSRSLVREGAAKALGVMGDAARPATAALTEALCDTDGYLRREAGDTLLKLGVGTKEILAAIETLRSDPPAPRKWAAEKLASYGTQASPAVQSLERLLNDPNEEVRAAAADALAKIQIHPGSERTEP